MARVYLSFIYLILLLLSCKDQSEQHVGELSFELPKDWKQVEPEYSSKYTLKSKTAIMNHSDEGVISIKIRERNGETLETIQKNVSFYTIKKMSEVRSKLSAIQKPELALETLKIDVVKIDGFETRKVVNPMYRNVNGIWSKYKDINYILFTDKFYYILSLYIPEKHSNIEAVGKEFIGNISINEE